MWERQRLLISIVGAVKQMSAEHVPTTPGMASPTGSGSNPLIGVLKLRNYRRLWAAMTVSSLGDWIGLYALLTITERVAPGNPLAIGGLMLFRVAPALLFGPLAGVALDRWDRRKAMILCDVLRAGLIATVPFAGTLPHLYAVSFLLEATAIVWMPAKDSLVPALVPQRWLIAANSLALFSTYGVFPLGGLIYTGLVGASEFLGSTVGGFQQLNQETIALWLDAATFLTSALIVFRIKIPKIPREKRPLRVKIVVDEISEGLRYLVGHGEVARVMRGMAVALAGGAVIFSLGTPYTKEILGAGAKGFGLIVTFLGTGMGVGVLVLGVLGDRLPKAWIFSVGIIGGGVSLTLLSSVDQIITAMFLAGALGTFAGIATATCFAMIQERVVDALRGRTFASVQIVIRFSLFISLLAFPVLAEIFGSILDSPEEGMRLAIAAGGLIGVGAGTLTAADVVRGRLG